MKQATKTQIAGGVALAGALGATTWTVAHRGDPMPAAPEARTAATATASASAAPPVSARPPGERTLELLSPTYEVDRIYKSMQGPESTRPVSLIEPPAAGDAGTPELLWITGFEATMAAADGTTPMPQDFMCHSNLDFDPTRHKELFGAKKSITTRLFTLSQGQLAIEMPPGFGIPVLSSEALSLTTQVLNLNHHGSPLQVRHRTSVRFVRDAEAPLPMKPLYMAGAYGLKLLEGKNAYFGLEEKPDDQRHGTGCMMGESASDFAYSDTAGKSFTGHWVVKPGREENRTLVTKILDLPFDTTAHTIAVHLHPFAESLELFDLTVKKTVYKATARQFTGKIGLAHVDSYASVEGIPLYKDHEYELISVYENNSGVDQDSMAVMLLYLADKEFARPALGAPAPAP